MLIDFHTHVFPEKIAARSIVALTAGIHNIQGADYGNGAPLTFREATVQALFDTMPASGVTQSICLPIATKPSQTAHINDFAAEVTRFGNAHGKSLLSFGTLHPENDDFAEILERLADAGFRGIKLHLQFQLHDIDSPEVIRILKKATRLGLLVIFHAGADIGLPPPVFTTPEKISHVLGEVDGRMLIAAHMGGWQEWDDVEKYLVGTDINFDTAFVRDFLPAAQAKRIIQTHGADKVLFGSDSPWEDPADTLTYLQSLGLTDAELDLITHKNAQRLLGDAAASDA